MKNNLTLMTLILSLSAGCKTNLQFKKGSFSSAKATQQQDIQSQPPLIISENTQEKTQEEAPKPPSNPDHQTQDTLYTYFYGLLQNRIEENMFLNHDNKEKIENEILNNLENIRTQSDTLNTNERAFAQIMEEISKNSITSNHFSITEEQKKQINNIINNIINDTIRPIPSSETPNTKNRSWVEWGKSLFPKNTQQHIENFIQDTFEDLFNDLIHEGISNFKTELKEEIAKIIKRNVAGILRNILAFRHDTQNDKEHALAEMLKKNIHYAHELNTTEKSTIKDHAKNIIHEQIRKEITKMDSKEI